jgi:hypothetical protein
MNTRKQEIKDIVLRIIEDPAGSPVHSFDGLRRRVIAVLDPQSESARAAEQMRAATFNREAHEPDLSEDDWTLLSETYWDLVLERVITPGINSQNREFDRFRIHSEYLEKRKESG